MHPLAERLGRRYLGQPGSSHPSEKETLVLPIKTRLPAEKARGVGRRQKQLNPALAACQRRRRALSALKTGLKMAWLYLSYLLYAESLQRMAGFHIEFSLLIPLC